MGCSLYNTIADKVQVLQEKLLVSAGAWLPLAVENEENDPKPLPFTYPTTPAMAAGLVRRKLEIVQLEPRILVFKTSLC
jgi:hypothetical protein